MVLILCWLIFDYLNQARANSVFWSRALNIPFPHSYVFPQVQKDQGNHSSTDVLEFSCCDNSGQNLISEKDERSEIFFPFLWASFSLPILTIEGFF